MTIFRFEMKSKIMTIIYWGIALLIVNLLSYSAFPMIAKEAELFDNLMNQFPEEYLKAFGLSGLPMSTVEGYTSLMLTFGLLITSIFSAMQGFSMLTKEESSQTADFLLSKPISRLKIFLSKLLASAIAIFCVGSIYLVSVYLGVILFKGEATADIPLILYTLTSIFFISYFFFGLSVFLSTFMKKLKSVISPALGLSVLFYSINGLAQAIESDSTFAWNPFTIFEFSGIYTSKSLPLGAVVYSLIVIAITLGFSYQKYNNKDIASL